MASRGAHLLKEIENGIIPLSEILSALRARFGKPAESLALPAGLWRLVTANSSPALLAIKSTPNSAASLALLHHILIYQLSVCNEAVALVDYTGRFLVAHLRNSCGTEDLRHLHVFQPTTHISNITDAVKQWMLHGNHESHDKKWVSTIIIGGAEVRDWLGMGRITITVGWKGWLNVIKEKKTYAEGVSLEEALDTKFLNESITWRAWCEEGEYRWQQ
ncbi:BgTH12-03645 [Blumeria graminis f. sp. triticale]|uniref:BgTH12-03645 n=1 Tax=Blumeria graminis f. sp. triticale TaxID=1689686 RepID=A0A9W4CVY3_BLUGR|nr:BgTH12-03645 [Blumeria graminis f. sp. triticale]